MYPPKRLLWTILPFALGIAAGIGIGSTIGDSREARSAGQHSQEAEPRLLTAVPDLLQDTDYSCGASALQAVFAYWGIDVRENTLAQELGTDPQNGTKPQDIVRVARDYGLRAEMKEDLSIQDLQRALEKDIPVIVDIQAWPEREETTLNWEDRWEDGHYVVVIGVDKTNIYVEDPSLLGTRGMIPGAEFLNRWHDYEGDPPYQPEKSRAYTHLGFFIEGARRTRSVTIAPVQ